MSELWKRKLLAFLHDPPEKAYDFSPEHGKRAKLYAERIDLNLAEWKDKLADHTAAAADRFIFSTSKRMEGGRWEDTGAPGLGGGLQFIHPLAGSKVDVAFPTEEWMSPFPPKTKRWAFAAMGSPISLASMIRNCASG